MSSFVDVLISSFSQLAAVLLISVLVYGFTKFFSRKKGRSSFFDFMGFRKPDQQIDKTFFVILAGSVLFRGLFARRLFRKFGFQIGNMIQATIFWLMHLMIFKLVTGEWFSWIQLYAFAISFGLGLVLGFVNYRKGGQSIAPSWLLHGATNLTTYLVLGFITT